MTNKISDKKIDGNKWRNSDQRSLTKVAVKKTLYHRYLWLNIECELDGESDDMSGMVCDKRMLVQLKVAVYKAII